MFIASLLKWWYSAGYIRCARGWMTRLESALDYFSIDLLLKTMFSLFRQDGAVGSGGALNIRIRRFFERLVSRLIGACIRSIVLIIGLLAPMRFNSSTCMKRFSNTVSVSSSDLFWRSLKY